ncbi:MAG TPA: hypothetical protein VGJ28_09515 [Micromonosporaceae bacterium]
MRRWWYSARLPCRPLRRVQYYNGTGSTVCINPGAVYSLGTNTRLQETYNQAPCSAGGAPYPY